MNRSTPRKRFRGWLFVAMAGTNGANDPSPISRFRVCLSFAEACLHLSSDEDARGCILLLAPGEGQAWRSYLAGGPPPYPEIPTSAASENLLTAIVRDARVSRPTARAALRDTLREAKGIGGALYRIAEDCRSDSRKAVIFSRLTRGAPMT